MSNYRNILPLLLVFGVGSALLGFGFASLDDEANIDSAVGSAVESALAAVTPEPTPEPTPIPTPWIITEAPPECIDAIDTLLDQSLPRMQFIIDVLSAYVDFPNENLEQFGARVETIIELLDDPPSEAATAEMLRLVDVCRAA